jgi:predicted lipoprotein with Yx(FWY)xxD motif
MDARVGRSYTEDARQRVAGLLAVAALSVAALAASSLASSPPASAGTAVVARSASVKVLTIKTERVAHVGTVLATSAGMTLYRWTVDPAGKATCTGACAKVWPPLLLPKGVKHIKAPHGVKGLSVVRVAGGRLQVFFHHRALYGFVSDKKKGQATGQNVENTWFAVLANGKSSAPATTSTTAPSGTGTTAPAATNPPAATTPGTTKGTTKVSPPSAPAATPGSTGPPATTPPMTTSPPATTPTTTRTTTPPPPPTTTTTTAPPPGGGVAF